MQKISFSDYKNKAFGCWLGKSIGGACGALSENNKSILSYTMDNVFPDVIPPNDDLDLQILWLVDLLEKKGTALTPADFARSFAEHNICLANEYAVAIKNIQMGIMPPYSGSFANDYFKNSMGCPIRSEIWGVVAPGSFDTVIRYATADGMVDHTCESIYSEIFNAVLESAAFFESDFLKLIETALCYVPEESRIFSVVNFVLDCFNSGLDWADARNTLVRNYGSADASYCVVNCGLTLLSLLYGGGDFSKTLLYSVNGGFDTDCTAATAMSIIGIVCGADNIPEFWLDKIGTKLVVGTVDIKSPYDTIEKFAEASCRAGLSFYEEGLLDVEITDIPSGIKGSLPDSDYPDISITADYDGEPSIGVGESKTVYITLTNNSEKPITNTLSVTPAESLLCDMTMAEITVPANDAVTFNVVFTVRENLTEFPLKNVSVAAFGDSSLEFGLCGAMAMKMAGPFWDNYDTKLYDSDPYEMKMQKVPGGGADIRAMFGSYVNIDREYTDENFVDGKDFEVSKKINVHSDVFDVEKDITYRGDCCVYLAYDFETFSEFEGVAQFGNNAPFKVWADGKLLGENKDYMCFMPYNFTYGLKLAPGKHRMIFKLLRSDVLKFGMVLRNSNDKARFFHDLSSIL